MPPVVGKRPPWLPKPLKTAMVVVGYMEVALPKSREMRKSGGFVVKFILDLELIKIYTNIHSTLLHHAPGGDVRSHRPLTDDGGRDLLRHRQASPAPSPPRLRP
jgi:hypothetical protein